MRVETQLLHKEVSIFSLLLSSSFYTHDNISPIFHFDDLNIARKKGRGNLWMATPSPKIFYTYCLCNGSPFATSNDHSSEYQLSVSINVRDGKPTRPQCMCVLVLGSTDNTGYRTKREARCGAVIWMRCSLLPIDLGLLVGKIRRCNLVEGRASLLWIRDFKTPCQAQSRSFSFSVCWLIISM